MKVFKGKQFSRWANGEAIGDPDLCQVAAGALVWRIEALSAKGTILEMECGT
jgi:hypothetical protein